MNRAWAQEPALLCHKATMAVPGNEPGNKEGPSDGSQQRCEPGGEREPSGPTENQQEAKLLWRQEGRQKPDEGADTACGATCSEQKEKANAGHQLGINQNSSSAVPSSCLRKALAMRTGNDFCFRHTLPALIPAYTSPGNFHPHGLSGRMNCRFPEAGKAFSSSQPHSLPGTERSS